MGESEGSLLNSPVMEKMDSSDSASIFKGHGSHGLVGAIFVAVLIPLLLSVILVGKKKVKQRGIPVQVSGEPGLAMRNGRSAKLVEAPWEGATTMAALFEQSCKRHTISWSKKAN